jgi:hypothetical protein
MKINSGVNTNVTPSMKQIEREKIHEPKDEVILSGNQDINSSASKSEHELLSFGPGGVRVQFGEPSMFGGGYKNMTKVVLTDKGIYGAPTFPFNIFSKKKQFDIPHSSIISVEGGNHSFSSGMSIKYREGNEVKTLTVDSGSVPQACRLLSDLLKRN